jgi:hypothetical protein
MFFLLLLFVPIILDDLLLLLDTRCVVHIELDVSTCVATYRAYQSNISHFQNLAPWGEHSTIRSQDVAKKKKYEPKRYSLNFL